MLGRAVSGEAGAIFRFLTTHVASGDVAWALYEDVVDGIPWATFWRSDHRFCRWGFGAKNFTAAFAQVCGRALFVFLRGLTG